jgi:hypothetical protein
MAPSRARALLRLERLTLSSPAFREAWRAGRISWTQAHALAPLLVLEQSLPWHGAWIERARGRPSRRNQAFEEMLDHALEAWGRDRPLPKKYRVFSRDGWRCTVPGCTAYRNLQDHHIQFRAAGGSDDLDNRTTLCVWHHLRAVHASLIRCTSRAPGQLRFALGLREGRAPLEIYASGDLVSGGQ